MIKKKKYFKTKAFSGHMLGIKIQDLGFFYYYYMDYISNLTLSSSIGITAFDS